MKRKLRKSLSWLLTVAMVISLFCGMIPTASAATVTGSNNYVTVDYDNTGASSNSTLMVQVFGIDGTTVETIEITDAALESQVVTINLTSAVSTTYDMEEVTISGSGTTQVPTLSSDSYSVRWMPTAHQDTSISVYLCNQFVPPEIKNPIDTSVTIAYHISEPQMLKILHNANVDLADVDLENIDAQVRYVEQYGLNWTNSFSDINRAADTIPYYNMDLEKSISFCFPDVSGRFAVFLLFLFGNRHHQLNPINLIAFAGARIIVYGNNICFRKTLFDFLDKAFSCNMVRETAERLHT